ncbi:hypothetical protein GALMADRAFT_132686 [Galerina marginata CBS 339.88]|uniref:Uncharacterized protein n=1 Tax=Galerina marginata (strain CBS 339.88) TaxID=685588 RepID=A0A067U3S0_GALM3|nr:hypothetical protein GALMADRAFT_132686 [Galerina marginata CBS 339.88]
MTSSSYHISHRSTPFRPQLVYYLPDANNGNLYHVALPPSNLKDVDRHSYLRTLWGWLKHEDIPVVWKTHKMFRSFG